MSVVKNSTKKRKVCVEFRDLIDFEMPLWRDVASIIFLYLDDGDLNRFFRASKVLFGLVKERAVFRNPQTFRNTVESNSIFRNFYFKEVHLLCEVKLVPASDVDQLLRQRFLVTFFSNGHVFDYRVFLRQNESGRPLFPDLRIICHSTDNFDVCYFWEFLEQFPWKIDLRIDPVTWGNEQLQHESLKMSGECFKTLVNSSSKINFINFFLPLKIDSQTSDYTNFFEGLSLMEAKELIVGNLGENQQFATFMECLAKNSKLNCLGITFPGQKSLERVVEIASDPECLSNLAVLSITLLRRDIVEVLRGMRPLLKKLKTIHFVLMGVSVDDEILEGFRILGEEIKARENREWNMWIKPYRPRQFNHTSITFIRRTSRV